MDKPLHVQVAEALGCRPVPHYSRSHLGIWTCGCEIAQPHNCNDDGPRDTELKPYDTDWAATGPLIEKYGISLIWKCPWWAEAGELSNTEHVEDREPLIAVCRLILRLAEAGKL